MVKKIKQVFVKTNEQISQMAKDVKGMSVDDVVELSDAHYRQYLSAYFMLKSRFNMITDSFKDELSFKLLG